MTPAAGKAEALLQGWFDLSNSNKLSDDHYRVRCTYAPVRQLLEIEPKFERSCIAEELLNGMRWERHPSCTRIDETPGERVFWDASLPHEFLDQLIQRWIDDGYCGDWIGRVAAWADSFGYRFAIVNEAIEFAATHPMVQQGMHFLLALGSYVISYGNETYAVELVGRDEIVRKFYGDPPLNGRVIRTYRRSSILAGIHHILLVQK